MRGIAEAPVLIVTRDVNAPGARRLLDAGASLLEASSLDEALRGLRERGVRSLLVEGGATLVESFFVADAVDRLITFQSPVRLGHGSLSAFSSVRAATFDKTFRLIERRAIEDDVMTVLASGASGVHRPD
jgi:riboflavin biosynthesis pyrimidine reductase